MESALAWRQTASPTRQKRRPVDLVHLSRHTLGEMELEREVLELFCAQSGVYLDRLRAAASEQHWREAAHSLKGSAEAIGAWRAADAAERAERLTGAALGLARIERLRELESSVQEARAYIKSLF